MIVAERYRWLLLACALANLETARADERNVKEVVVGGVSAPLKVGAREITVESGTDLRVIQTHGSYFLVDFAGRQGWIHRNQVRAAGAIPEFGQRPYPLATIVGRDSPSVIRLALARSPSTLIHNLQISGRDQEILDHESDLLTYAAKGPIHGTPLIGQLASVRAARGELAKAQRQFHEVAQDASNQLSTSQPPPEALRFFGDPRVSVAQMLGAAGWCLANAGDPRAGERYLRQASEWIEQNIPAKDSSILDERLHVWRADVALRNGDLRVAELELSRAARRRSSHESFIFAPRPGPQDPGLEGSGGYQEAVQAILHFALGEPEKSARAAAAALSQSLRGALNPGKYPDAYLEIRVREKPDFQSGDNYDSTFPLNVALSVARRAQNNLANHDPLAEWLLNSKAMQEMALRTQLRAYREIATGGERSLSSLLAGQSPPPSLAELRVARGLTADFALRHVAIDELDDLRREFEGLRAASLEMTAPRLPQLFVVPQEITKQYYRGVYDYLRPRDKGDEQRDPAQVGRDKRAVKDWLDQEISRKWVAAAQVKKSLYEGQAILTIVKHRDLNLEQLGGGYRWQRERYAAALLTKNGETVYADLGVAEDIDLEVSRIREGIAGVTPQVIQRAFDERQETRKLRALMRPLAERLLAPFQKTLGTTRELILQPDGSLWLLPWPALPWSDSEMLIDRFAIRLSDGSRSHWGDEFEPDIHVPDDAKTPVPPRGPPLLIGDPDFAISTEVVRESERRLLDRTLDKPLIEAARRGMSLLPKAQRLDFSRAEVEAIAPLVEKYTGETPRVFLGQDAIEGIFHKHVNPRILVISSHGFFLSTPSIPDQRSVIPVRDPTMRCGLLLAGSDTRDELPVYRETDGVLTGYEASCLDLRDTELVVLSACDTGVGSVKAFEGVRGLRQAFLAAGAKSVVSTLWQVPDRDSQLIVTEFFQRLAGGEARAEALRSSQLKRIRERRERWGDAHPFFWCAWTVTER